MNERVPDSSGLPLRAMVMVLIFLGGVFLLVAFQAMSSSGPSTSTSATTSQSTSANAETTTSEAPAPKPEVRVYNISEVEGAAARVAEQLTGAEWVVSETGNLGELVGPEGPPELPGVVENTVYYGEAEGEKEAAEEIGTLLQAPVHPRSPEISWQPPGVIVVVTG
ncbi:LytR C-terminal domain-containing protein [Mycolicibacterium brumae]|uniref:LytR/CpsA/Psr regulator C-terminal domain-containing protein n=1 Tax=Mycolicibacterium brumae TaxID=85968 RepID=A0A2G5PHE1_9MYCO|nr:LytR C-terminal domain-containing protein [Mycolicibacterium brumae]MCV7192566.1 LytR C-terminal domain-containing protein [Mycolicibacterium brumae]PIB77728.1 hypothetical protein CQY22_000235 [Mycolicibacterium brumae]UWW10336.1 LytR C-terminal domain-containing protein [Mycolicibacterium brumae]